MLLPDAHLGSPSTEQRVHFEVCFTAGFSGWLIFYYYGHTGHVHLQIKHDTAWYLQKDHISFVT